MAEAATDRDMQWEEAAATVAIYGAAWNEPDAARRLDLLGRSWTDDGVYQDPQSRAEGRDALSRLIAGFQSRTHGSRIQITSGVDSHGRVLRFQWQMVGQDGEPGLEGVDFGELAEDGRLRRITGFFGPFPPLSR